MRGAPALGMRPSTSLGTNEVGALHRANGLNAALKRPFVPSEVEGRWHELNADLGAILKNPFVPSEVEGRWHGFNAGGRA